MKFMNLTKKSWLAIAIIVAMMAAMLTSCGDNHAHSGESSPGSQSAVSSDVDSSTPADSSEPVDSSELGDSSEPGDVSDGEEDEEPGVDADKEPADKNPADKGDSNESGDTSKEDPDNGKSDDTPKDEPKDESKDESKDEPKDESKDEEPEQVQFTSVNETVYATGSVNVRKGPSGDHERLGQLKKDESVQRIGVGDNGWSKIMFNGAEAYVSSKYLTTTKPSSGDAGSTGNNSSSGDSSGGGSSSGSNTPDSGSSGGNSSGGGSSSGGNNSSGNNGSSSGVAVQRADITTGISWDGKSPIIYTYADGTTGTTPKDGATYEVLPGVVNTYTAPVKGSVTDEERESGQYRCGYCDRVLGDGSGDTCQHWISGEHNCSSCGETVPAHHCHNCTSGNTPW